MNQQKITTHRSATPQGRQIRPGGVLQRRSVNQAEPAATSGSHETLRPTSPGGFAHDFSQVGTHTAAPQPLRARTAAGAGNQAEPGSIPPIVQEVLRSPGQPLDAITQEFMESRFGDDLGGAQVSTRTGSSVQAKLTLGSAGDEFEHEADATAHRVAAITEPLSEDRYDFSGVRIHADSQASKAAGALNALAFTVGHHIVFDAGQYSPQTGSGQRLLAHELTHVIQQTGHEAGGDTAQPALVKHHTPGPLVQGRWRLDRVRSDTREETRYTRENGNAISLPRHHDLSLSGGAHALAIAWQEMGWWYPEVGGEAQVSRWLTKHFIFRNDGTGGDFLQLRMDAQYSGSAKAEDLRYARAGSVVWGRITERTAANPAPPDREWFEIAGGGISAATVGELGTIEVEIPVGEGGSARATIPLTKVDEGEFVPYSDSIHQLHDVSGAIDEVDVLLGARVEADADTTTGYGMLLDTNRARATGLFALDWESRPTPGGASRAGAGTEASPGTGAGTGPAATSAQEILHRSPDSRESVSRLARKAQEAEDNPRVGLHGVSSFTEPMDWPHSRAPRSEVERYFPVRNTLGPTHRTIVLPKPVTSRDANQFNRVFGR